MPIITYYVAPYESPIPFPGRLAHHAKEALVSRLMKSLREIRVNLPLIKEIRKTDDYANHIKNLVVNKPRTLEGGDVKLNVRCSAVLQNQLPPKEKDSRSFILPCSIGNLTIRNALAHLGASISIMPLSMYKQLGLGILNLVNMTMVMADRNMVKDFRMPIILGRSLLATAHAKIDVFIKLISLEVGNEKVVFKIEDNINETLTPIESPNIACILEEKIYVAYDEGDSSENLENFGDKRMELIIDIVEDHLNDDWFTGMTDDDDDLDCIVNYLELQSYDEFVDIKDEVYKERMCKLIGMMYKKPSPIINKKAKITRYTVGPGESYKKVKILEMKEMPRTNSNIAMIRANLMKEIDIAGSVQRTTQTSFESNLKTWINKSTCRENLLLQRRERGLMMPQLMVK
ncbi:hypothetical protein Tco_1027972 [Tanacetum coccineum]